MAYENITVPVVSYKGRKVGETQLSGPIFNSEINEYAIQRAVKVDLANRRVDTAHTLTRDIVHGSNKKPWRQKGTGRARSGTANSPVWRHGGVVHGPNGMQNHHLKMNKNEHFVAWCSALSSKAKEGNVIVLQDKEFDSKKTKDFAEVLKAIKADEKKNLLIICEYDENLILASSNLSNVKVVDCENISVYDVLNANKVIFLQSALPIVELDEDEAE